MYTQYSTSVSFVKYYLHKNEHEILFKINDLAPPKTVTISNGYKLRHTAAAAAHDSAAHQPKYNNSSTISATLTSLGSCADILRR